MLCDTLYEHHCMNIECCLRLGMAFNINFAADYSCEYKKEILLPILCNIACANGQSNMYDGLNAQLEPLVLPNGTSETEVKTRQVSRLSM